MLVLWIALTRHVRLLDKERSCSREPHRAVRELGIRAPPKIREEISTGEKTGDVEGMNEEVSENSGENDTFAEEVNLEW